MRSRPGGPGRARGRGSFATAALVAVAVAAVAAAGIVALHKQLVSGNDFPLYYRAAVALRQGASPYDVASGLNGYVYLPTLALCLVPLTWIPLPPAILVWYAILVGLLALSIRWTRDCLRLAGCPRPGTMALAAAIALAPYALDNLALGQANPIVLALSLLGTRRALAGRPDALSGAAFGLAAAVKPHALLLALPMALRRHWSLALGAGIALVVAALVFPALALGPSRTVSLLEDWNRKVVAPARAGTLQGSIVWDQSPQAALRRLLVDDPAFDRRKVNVAALSPRGYAVVGRATSLAILAALAAVWLFAPRRRNSREETLLDLALASCAMLLVVGFHLKAQFVQLLLPCALGLGWAWSSGGPASRVLTGVAAVLLLVSSPGIVGRAASNWLLAYSSVTLATLVITGQLAWLRLSGKGGFDYS